MKFRVIILVLFPLFQSCTNTPHNVNLILDKSGNNRPELEKVIAHFKSEGNDEKLKATYFLIGNMNNEFSYEGDEVTNYDVLFKILDSLHRKKVKILTESPILKVKWDSLMNIYDRPSRIAAEKVFDYSAIKTDFLIKNINSAYIQWKDQAANKHLSFNEFCEYLLPYRVGTERLEQWRDHLFQAYQPLLNKTQINDRFSTAKNINALLRKTIALNHTIDKYPFDMTARQMEMAKRGACKHLVNYEAMVMRANGIPVSLEEAPLWGDMNRGHQWLALIRDNGKPYAFNAAQDEFGGVLKGPYRFAKVYRSAIEKQPNSPSFIKDIPANLLNDYRKDVTSEYTKTSTITVKLKYQSLSHPEHAIICTYGHQWEAQDWGDIKSGAVKFKNIGSNLVYIVMYYENHKLVPATDPFILTKQEIQIPLTAKVGQLLQKIILERKYPNFPLNIHNASYLVGGKFQVANRASFSDAKDLYTIPAIPLRYYDIANIPRGSFRYVRYLTGKGQKTNLAEMEVYGIDRKKDTIKLNGAIKGKPEISPELGTSYPNAFDGKPETYFSGDKDSLSWAGLDLQHAQKIVKIRFYPRSDTNFIIPGDCYELKMWDKNKWILLNKQIATSWQITFNNVPENVLLILHNTTRGKEERIFTYGHGKQVWW